MKPVLLFFLLFLPAAAFAQTQQLKRGVVTGRIVSVDGTPADGVRVAAMEVKEENGQDTVSVLISIAATDAQGRYRLEDIPPGRYYIVAGKLDHSSYFPGVNTPSKANAVKVDGSTVFGVDFMMAASLKISGHVVGRDASGNPLATMLQLFSVSSRSDSSSIISTSIAPDGAFEFRDVPPGTYQIEPNTRDIRPDTRQGLSIAIHPGTSTGAPGSYILVDERSITGVIVSIAGPIEGRVVTDRKGPIPPFTLTFVDKEGHPFSVTASNEWTFSTGLQDGEYTVSIADLADGYSPQSIVYGGKDILHSRFTVTKDVRALVINIAISDPPPWARIHGRLTLPASLTTPLTLAFWAPGAPWRRIDVAPDGTFQANLLPGTYKFQIEGYFPDFILQSFSDGKHDLLQESVDIQWRDTIEMKATLDRVPPVRISGHVTGAENVGGSQPLTVELLRLGRTQRFEQPVHADGTFEFAELPPGFYRIGIREELAVTRTTILDADRNVSNFEVQIPPQVRIAGRVTVETDALTDFGNMAVMAIGPHAATGGSVHPDGSFSFMSTEGLQQITVRSIPAGYTVKAATSGPIDLEKEAISPKGAVEVRVVLIKR